MLGQGPNPEFSFSAGASLAYSPALGSDGTLYFGTRAGDVFAVASNGAERWRLRLPRSVAAPITLTGDDTIIVGALDGALRGISSAGVIRWTFPTGNEIWGGAALGADGAIYFGSRDGNVYALHSNGSLRWQASLGGPVIDSPALAADGTLYVSARSDRLLALDPDGGVKWSLAISQPAAPAIGPDGTVYVGAGDSRLRAISPAGAVLWTHNTASAIRSSPTIAPDGRIFVTSWNGEVRCVRPDGTLSWSANLREDARYSAAALGADGNVYVVTVSGVLSSLRGTSGEVRWASEPQGRVDAGSPVIAPGGMVYFGTDAGRVLGFAGAGGPASGAWPLSGRDPRRSGGGFVQRELPAAYGAGAVAEVTLVATVPAGTSFYTVEDSPPANWLVGAISHAGTFDAAHRRVRFGPFRDGVSRRLSYLVTPPLGEAGARTFSGVTVSEGGEQWVMGRQVIQALPLHPADLQTVDGWLTLSEVTAYGAAWRRGTAWNIPPAVVPASFLDRAIEIWLAGEAYRYDTNFGTAPAWWRPVRDGQPLYPPPASSRASTPSGTIVSSLPSTASAGDLIEVTLTVNPATNVVAYGVEEAAPPGWAVVALSHSGVVDSYRARLKWGPFFDAVPRTLTYRLAVPASAAGIAAFTGAAAFDGAAATTTGARQIFVGTAEGAGIFVTRRLPERYFPGTPLAVRLDSTPPADSLYHFFEDSPPAGWMVTNISDGGWYDSTARRVRFGPFLDTLPRTVTYDVTPPATDSGPRQFTGVSTLNGVDAVIVGDAELNSLPLHPADLSPADGWLTLGEMTAYGAAWKRDNPWPMPPNVITGDYLVRAIQLWQGGEAYAFEDSVKSAPNWWIVSTNHFPAEAMPPSFPPGSVAPSGGVRRIAPRLFTNGVPTRIALEVTPATNTLVFAVEEQLPAGWQLLSASDGVSSVTRGKLRWGPFFDARPRTLTCDLVATATAADATAWSGHGAFDGLGVETAGARQIFRADAALAPEFTASRFIPGSGFELTLKGLAGEAYVLLASTNLASWQPLTTLTNFTGIVKYLDTGATNDAGRFYRALWP